MAVALTWKAQPEDPRERLMARLAQAPIEHAEAVLAAYDLLQRAHDHGVLDVVRGLLGASTDVVNHLASATSRPEAIRLVRNLVSLGNIVASFDPAVLHRLADELARQPLAAATPPPPPGIFSIARQLFSKDTRRVLAGSVAFLNAFGRALGTPRTRR